jgi:hypothetical protein
MSFLDLTRVMSGLYVEVYPASLRGRAGSAAHLLYHFPEKIAVKGVSDGFLTGARKPMDRENGRAGG